MSVSRGLYRHPATALDQLLKVLMATGAALAGAGGPAQLAQGADLLQLQRLNDLRFLDLQTLTDNPILGSADSIFAGKVPHGGISQNGG